MFLRPILVFVILVVLVVLVFVVVVVAAAVAVVVGFLRAFGQCTTVATVNQLHFCNKDPSHSHVVCPRSFRSKPLPSPKRTCGERQNVLAISQGCLQKAKKIADDVGATDSLRFC
jgi:hypothetical protein